VKKIVKRLLDGTVSLPGKYGNLIKEDLSGYRGEKPWLEVRHKTALKMNKSSR
jgi:hypothetical protein